MTTATPTTMTPTGITRQLAEFAVSPAPRTAPAAVRDVVRRTIVHSVVLGASAGHHDAVRVAWDLARSAGSPPSASVLGTTERTGVLSAPLIHGIAMHVEDFDDTHPETVIHPGAPVVGAALTAAQLATASGAQLMDAVLAGVEVALRVGIGICPSHFDIGWHITGTAGHLGAAAAAARLLGLDAGQAAVALALACVEAAGLTEANGSMTESLHPGKAAADGLEAAMLAGHGLTGPPDPIEGPRGLAALTSQERDLGVMVEGLGATWRTLDNVTTDPAVARDEAYVTVVTADGQQLPEHVEHATGSLSRPMTDAQLRDKCRLVGRPALGDRIEDLITLLFSVEQLETLQSLFAASAT